MKLFVLTILLLFLNACFGMDNQGSSNQNQGKSLIKAGSSSAYASLNEDEIISLEEMEKKRKVGKSSRVI